MRIATPGRLCRAGRTRTLSRPKAERPIMAFDTFDGVSKGGTHRDFRRSGREAGSKAASKGIVWMGWAHSLGIAHSGGHAGGRRLDLPVDRHSKRPSRI